MKLPKLNNILLFKWYLHPEYRIKKDRSDDKRDIVCGNLCVLIVWGSIFLQALSLLGLLYPKKLNRDIPLSFALVPHIRAPWEAQRQAYHLNKDRQKRKINYRKPYFQASFHPVAINHHRLYKLITIYEDTQAHKCLAVLNAAKEILGGALGIGKKAAPMPEQEWRSQAGDLPE